MIDYLIRNGMIVDGSGQKPVRADLAVENGKITGMASHIEVPSDLPYSHIIDARDAYVTPGFVDIHRHGDWLALVNGDDELLNRQGITTAINGNCGLSIAPAGEEHRDSILSFLASVVGNPTTNAAIASTMSDYLSALARTKRSVNTGMLVGNGTLRASVAGYRIGPLTDSEITMIRHRLEASLAASALGVSVGLAYAPEFAYDKESLVQVLAPVRGSSVPLIAHIRNEGDGLADSVREMLAAAETLRVPLHISHMKCIGKPNWQKQSLEVMEEIRHAREKGMKVDFDLYPYITGSTQLVHLLPPAFQAGGKEEILRRLTNPSVRKSITEVLEEPSKEFENIVLLAGFERIYVGTLTSDLYHAYEGRSIAEIAAELKADPFDVLYDILIAEDVSAPMFDTYGCSEDMNLYYRDPWASVISDSIYPSGGKVHPRVYAAFPKFLIDEVRETDTFTIEEAVRKMTALPASVLGLDRGFLQAGAPADLNVFRLEDLKASADFRQPEQFSEGFQLVMTGGRPVVRNDRWLGGSGGTVLMST